MALLHMDGFEGYGREDVTSFWSSTSFIGGGAAIDQNGRRGGYCVNSPNWISSSESSLTWNNPNPFDNQVIVVGCAFKHNSIGNYGNFLNILSAQGETVGKVYINNTEKLFIQYQPFGTADTLFTTTQLDANTWYYLELKAKMHGSEGIVQFRLNEELIVDRSGLDTVAYNSSGTQIGGVQFSFAIYGRWWLDDIYILDTTGSKNNDFLGDIRIDSIYPSGVGNYTDLTPSAGNNYECIDEINMDSADYVEGANAGEKDSYAYADVPTDLDDAAIYGIQLRNQVIRTAESDNIKAKGFLRTGSTDYAETTGQSLSDIYKSKIVVWEDDPSDSGDWTKAKINACEFGMEVA